MEVVLEQPFYTFLQTWLQVSSRYWMREQEVRVWHDSAVSMYFLSRQLQVDIKKSNTKVFYFSLSLSLFFFQKDQLLLREDSRTAKDSRICVV
jgi:hypothetical protein